MTIAIFAFVAGMIIGGTLGALAMAVVVAGRSADAHLERITGNGYDGDDSSLGMDIDVSGDGAGDSARGIALADVIALAEANERADFYYNLYRNEIDKRMAG